MTMDVLNYLFLLAIFCRFSYGADWDYFKKASAKNSPKIVGIVGGTEAVPHAYPYQVAVLINNNAFCGGVLISKNYVLTAANCLNSAAEKVEVILGAHNIKMNESTQVHIQSSEFKIHEDYNATFHYSNLAIIKLSQPAPLDDVIKVIDMPPASDVDNHYTDIVASATGWGLTTERPLDPTTNDLSHVLRVVNLTIIVIWNCYPYYNDINSDMVYVREDNVCTSGYQDLGTCYGDSGGPLAVGNVLLGIGSIGSDLCNNCMPSVFTKVANYLDWIKANSDI